MDANIVQLPFKAVIIQAKLTLLRLFRTHAHERVGVESRLTFRSVSAVELRTATRLSAVTQSAGASGLREADRGSAAVDVSLRWEQVC